ncbi:MAG: hypothetical protein ACJAYB_001251 [Psychromonas sp.]|jgi:hypothetical protein
MSIIPQNTQLGKLKLFEIYDDFEGPKCFSVKNNLEQLFLVYWSGDLHYESVTTWLYSPISHKRLDELRRQKFSIRDVYLEPEQCVYNIKIPFDASNDSVCSMLTSEQVLLTNLPPNIFYLEPAEIEVCAEEADWNFELLIAKKSKTLSSVSTSVVTKVINVLSAVIESLMEDDTREIPKLYPLTATFGSFEVKLGTNYPEKSSVAIEQLNALLSNTTSLDENLKNLGLDPYKLKDLLEIVSEDTLELTLKPKTYEYLQNHISIKSDELAPSIEVLKKSTATFIDSSLVPQSSDIDRIIDVVCRKVNGEFIQHDDIEGISSIRQVQYHTAAAYCLGLLNKNQSVTSAGRFLHHKESKNARYQYLSERFESSDLGWAWMKWANVNNIYDVQENTAKEFIKDCVKGLNSETSKRRASTISSWLRIFKKYSRDESLRKGN